MEAIIHQLIDQYNSTTIESDKQFLKNEIHFRYYHTSVEEQSSVRVAMQSFVDEIEQEMIEKDPLARKAYELINRVKVAKAAVRH